MATTAIEKSKTRSDLAQLAGMGPFSILAALAGVLVGYATSALLIAGTAAILERNNSTIDLTEPWESMSNGGGLLLGGLLFVSYLLAGYVAGRMAWRRGWLHGLAIFIGSVVVVGAVALLVRTLNNPDDVERITDTLRSFGIPTTRDEWGSAASFVGLVSLGGMLLGSLVGGILGERWYTKVSRRAVEAEVDIRERMEATSERLAPIDEEARTRQREDGTPIRQREVGNDRGNGGRADRGVDVDSMSKEELYEMAQERDIPGRSHMSKEELLQALKRERRTPQRQRR
ncbi:MAG: hypothetical protein AB1679_21960 [Actinomycetota bacterium]|jgi:hypothetical protein